MPTQRQLAESVIGRLREAGHETVLAGGCVRDLLLNRTPNDYDVATSARPETVLDLYPGALTVGQAFGVVIVHDGAMQVEVATFRSDAAYTDGRHPDAVTFTDARNDALRRDFTINAMFLDPESGEIVDHVGGKKDLKRRIIRAVGEARDRFAEDRLRMLRAVRFAAELEFDIEKATADAIRDLAAEIVSVSGERIAAELGRLLTAAPAGRRRGLQLADDLGLLAPILPEVHAMHGTEQGPIVHPEGDAFVHTVLCVEHLREPTFELALAALLHDIGKPATARFRDGKWTFYGHAATGEETAGRICRRLRLNNFERRRIAWLVGNHMNLLNSDQMRQARLKRLFAHDGFDELAELWRADCLASGGNADAYEALMVRYRAMGHHEVRPTPLISGRDLIRMGLEPGPAFRHILDHVYDAQLEGRAPTRDSALSLARKVAAEQSTSEG